MPRTSPRRSPDRAVLRWHLVGIAMGTAVTTACTTLLSMGASHHGGFWETSVTLLGAWGAMFILFSPFLYALLKMWASLSLRFPRLEESFALRILGLGVLAIIAAGIIYWCVSLGFIVARTPSLAQSLRTFGAEMFAFPETFAIFCLATHSWALLPRFVLTRSASQLPVSEHAT